MYFLIVILIYHTNFFASSFKFHDRIDSFLYKILILTRRGEMTCRHTFAEIFVPPLRNSVFNYLKLLNIFLSGFNTFDISNLLILDRD